MTERYTHLAPDYLVNACAKLDELLGYIVGNPLPFVRKDGRYKAKVPKRVPVALQPFEIP